MIYNLGQNFYGKITYNQWPRE